MIVKYTSSVGDILDIVEGTLLWGDGSEKIESISTDSREMAENCLYIPLKGEKFNGHTFIDGLCREKKISSFLTERPNDKRIAKKYSIPGIKCDDSLLALGMIASSYRSSLKYPLIGVTGTNGKTTTKELLSTILSSRFKVQKSEKNYNNEIGVPFTLLGLNKKTEFGVIEMGMNHAGEISRLSRMTRPECAVITNAGEGHLEFLKSVQNVALAKSEIFDGMEPGGAVFLNRESACLEVMKKKAVDKKLNVYYFGLDRFSDVHPDSYELLSDKIEVTYKGVKILVPLYGIHNVSNIMAAIAVAEHYGVTVREIKDSLKNFRNVDKRNELIDKKYIVINDSYNSNPLSLKSALTSMSSVFASKRKIAVLSDMKELGEKSSEYHFDAGELAARSVDVLFTWGLLAENISEGAVSAGMDSDKVRHFQDKNDLVQELKKMLNEGDVVLVKGSRSMKMEEVTDSIVRD